MKEWKLRVWKLRSVERNTEENPNSNETGNENHSKSNKNFQWKSSPSEWIFGNSTDALQSYSSLSPPKSSLTLIVSPTPKKLKKEKKGIR